MKGQGQIIGILMLLMITVIFIVDKNFNYNKQVDIAASSVQLYAMENDAESLKRSLDSAVYFSGLRALKETFGSAEQVWIHTNNADENPTESSFIETFKSNFLQKLNSLDAQKIGKSEIKWEPATASVEFLADGVRIRGNRSFTIKNSGNPEISFSVPGAFDRKVNVSAKKVFAAGKELLDGNWKVKKSIIDSEPGKCQDFASDMNKEGDYYTSPTGFNIILGAVMCGYGDFPGAISTGNYSEEKVRAAISAVLDAIKADAKQSTGYDYNFLASISAQTSGDKEKVSVQVSVEIIDKNSLVPDQNAMTALSLKYKTPVEFEMNRTIEVAQG